MITYKTNRLLVILGVAILVLAMNLKSAIAASGVVLVKRVGTVEVKSSQPNSWKPVTSGAVLSFGDVIRTGAQSKAEISFESGIIKMHENTILEIPSKFQQIPVREGTEKLRNVFLVKGRSLFQVFKNRLHNGFEVTTPSIIAGVKGTTFSVSEEEGHKGVAVMEGAVVVTNRKHPKESMEVRSGQFIMMMKDEHLAPAREFRDQNDLRLKEKRMKEKEVKSRADRQERLKDVKNDRKNDLKKEAQDRTGTGGFTLPGTSGNLASGVVDSFKKGGHSGSGNSGSGHGGSGNSGSGNSGSGNSGSGNSGSGSSGPN